MWQDRIGQKINTLPGFFDMETFQKRRSNRLGFSLVEILISLAIISIILFVLSLALGVSLDALRNHSSSNSIQTSVRTAVRSIEADLEGVVVDQPSSFSFGSQSIEGRARFLNRKKFMPIAINRTEGADQGQSFVNSESGFSSLLFASSISTSRYYHPLREQIRFSDGEGLGDFNQSAEAIGEVSICGYYVAYTNNSDRQDDGKSMKLYRHFRSGGITYDDGHSNGVLAFCSDVFDPVSERTVLNGSDWGNRSLPNILSKRYTRPGLFTAANVTQPWPLFGDGFSGIEPPGFDSGSWSDPDHGIHKFVFGDEPIMANVLEFECKPYKKVETSPGVFELFDSGALNAYLGVSNKDWPILIKPDFIDVSLGVVGADAVLIMKDKSDWQMPNMDVRLDQLSSIDRIKRRQLQRFSFRVNIN